jgi:hypothetical protein
MQTKSRWGRTSQSCSSQAYLTLACIMIMTFDEYFQDISVLR